MSEWTAEQIREGHKLARELRIPFVSNQPEYSMLFRVIEPDVVPASVELGVSQVVFSPIAQGILTGKYLPGQPPPADSRATDQSGGASMIRRWREDEELLRRVQDLRRIAEQAGISLAQLAVAWVLQNQNVAAAIIGASRPEQVAENAKASGVTLAGDVMKAIDGVLGDRIICDPSITATRSPTAE